MFRSPNCGPRKHGLPPDMVVLHYTAMDTAQAAIERLCSPQAEVSAHFVIAENGEVTQLVDENERAWHAGAGQWGSVSDVNSHSIGFELANKGPQSDDGHFPDAQMRSLEQHLARVMDQFQISPERVIGHSDMAPGRKIDPGPLFDWQRLASKGLSIWPSDVVSTSKQADLDDFAKAARVFGYRPPQENTEGWQTVLAAFRLRFRPNAVGPLEPHDIAIISQLAAKWPCKAVDLGAPINLKTNLRG